VRGQRKTVRVGSEQAARRSVVGVFARLLPGVASGKREELADVVLQAAAMHSSLTDACEATSGRYSRRELSRTLVQVELEDVEACLNDALFESAKGQLPSEFALSVDLTDIPYHGEDAGESGHSIRGQAKDGTTWKHRYATAYLTHAGHRHTLVVHHAPRGEKPHESLRRVVERLSVVGLLGRVRVVLADKGFYSVDAIRCLKEYDLSFVIPTQRKAQKIKAWCKQGKTTWRDFQVGNVDAKHEGVRIALVHVSKRGKKPPDAFPYATHKLQGTPRSVHLEYLKRGGIESAYRINNTTRARTSSRRIGTRVLYFALSMLLQNAWVSAKQTAARIEQMVLRYRPFIRHLVAHIKQIETKRDHTARGHG
jgi:hypothetical protein